MAPVQTARAKKLAAFEEKHAKGMQSIFCTFSEGICALLTRTLQITIQRQTFRSRKKAAASKRRRTMPRLSIMSQLGMPPYMITHFYIRTVPNFLPPARASSAKKKPLP